MSDTRSVRQLVCAHSTLANIGSVDASSGNRRETLEA